VVVCLRNEGDAFFDEKVQKVQWVDEFKSWEVRVWYFKDGLEERAVIMQPESLRVKDVQCGE